MDNKVDPYIFGFREILKVENKIVKKICTGHKFALC